jgi:hypothetical protein
MATHITTSPEVRKVVDAAIKSGAWHIEAGTKHHKIRHIESGRMISFPKTPSDNHRSHLNLKSEIRKVEAGRPGWGMQHR